MISRACCQPRSNPQLSVVIDGAGMQQRQKCSLGASLDQIRAARPILLVLALTACAAADRPTASPAPGTSRSQACAMAGEQCLKSLGPEAGCEASQLLCEAASAQAIEASRDAVARPSRYRPRSASLSPSPPPNPSGEAPDDHSDPQIVTECLAYLHQLVVVRLSGTIDRTLVTVNSKAGVVWRADFTISASGKPYAERYTCSRLGSSMTPIVMLGGRSLIDPLPPS